MNAVMLSAEMSLCAGEIARTRTLLLDSDLVVNLVGLDIGVLRLFLMRLEEQEREQKDDGSSSIEALTESLKLITLDEARLADVDSVRWMIGRIVESWKDLGTDLRVEEDVLVSVAVELGIYPSKGQRPAWVERGLTSRCLILMFRFIIITPELTHVHQTGVGAEQPGPRPGGQPEDGGGAVGAAETRGGGRGGGALLGGGGGALDPGGAGHRDTGQVI